MTVLGILEKTICNEELKEKWNTYLCKQITDDYWAVKTVMRELGYTTALYIWNQAQICIDVPEGYVIVNWCNGEVEQAGGKYIVLVGAVMQLAKEIVKDREEILTGKYEMIFSEQKIDIDQERRYRLSYTQAKEIYDTLLKAEKSGKYLWELIEKKEVVDAVQKEMQMKSAAIEYATIKAKTLVDSHGIVDRNEVVDKSLSIFTECFRAYFEEVRAYMTAIMEAMIDSLKESQLADLACYISYTITMGESAWEKLKE